MKRTMTEVRTFNVRLYCVCGGEMKSNGITLTTNPPMYPHVCDKCGTYQTLTGDSYPTTTEVEVGEEQVIQDE